MPDFSYTHVKTVKDGELGWKDPRPRGQIRIREDNQTMYYRLNSRKDLRDFKLWFENISEVQYGNKARLIGQYPEYELELG